MPLWLPLKYTGAQHVRIGNVMDAVLVLINQFFRLIL